MHLCDCLIHFLVHLQAAGKCPLVEFQLKEYTNLIQVFVCLTEILGKQDEQEQQMLLRIQMFLVPLCFNVFFPFQLSTF